MPKKKTREEFIRDAKEIHGDRYDYSKVEYVDSKTKVEIICEEHGSFWQIPNSHLAQKAGCPRCWKQMDCLEDFIKLAREVHGDRYDYSKAVYKAANQKLEIVCKEHGSFWQTPGNHTRHKQNCPSCAGLKRKTKEEFVQKAESIHGTQFDYSEVDYVNSSTPVKIRCRKHDVTYWMRPADHYNRKGCPGCRSISTEEIVGRFCSYPESENVDYSQVEYVNALTPVELICDTHGPYKQLAYNHITSLSSGYTGCPKCYMQVMNHRKPPVYNSTEPAYLYLLEMSNQRGGWVKVGVTVDPERRLSDFEKSGLLIDNALAWRGPAKEVWDIEAKIHSHTFKRYSQSEWDWGGRTECYSVLEKESLIDYISLCGAQLNKLEYR